MPTNDVCNVDEQAYWPNWLAGVALGIVLLLTFVLTGHGLGATGFTTRLSVWLGEFTLPSWTAHNNYFASFLEDGPVLSSWITWQVLGVFAGAIVSALMAHRVRWRVEGAMSAGRTGRLLKALSGGVLAGFGARIAAGCTSGVGLSGSAVLGIAGFVFLGAFFATGLVVSRMTGGGVH